LQYHLSMASSFDEECTQGRSADIKWIVRIGNVWGYVVLRPRTLERRLYPIRRKFLRKEVIQPQVPLRLPCYDLVPITEVTFDACVSCEFARRLRVPPAFVA
jgi:hypothetical protein